MNSIDPYNIIPEEWYDYWALIDWLNTKYGPVRQDYFVKWEKGKNGLYLLPDDYENYMQVTRHHVWEFMHPALSSQEKLDKDLLWTSRKEYLVYCDCFEHLLLHTLIHVQFNRKRSWNILPLMIDNMFNMMKNDNLFYSQFNYLWRWYWGYFHDKSPTLEKILIGKMNKFNMF